MKFLQRIKLRAYKKDAKRQSDYLYETKNLPLNQLKNYGLGRVLTEQEIAAVKWFSAYHNGVWNGMSNYDTAIRSLIISGYMPGIVDMHSRYAGDINHELDLLMYAEEMRENNR